MKRDFLNVQFILLILFLLYYSIFSHFNIPNMGIIIGLCSLYGYKMFLNTKIVEKEVVSPEKLELLSQIDTMRLNKEVLSLQADLYRISESKKDLKNGKEKQFIF